MSHHDGMISTTPHTRNVGPGGSLLDRRFVGWSIAWTAVSYVGLGLVSAIIPNPVFGRQIPPEPFAIWTWLASAPLAGMLLATWSAPPAMRGATPLTSLGPLTGTVSDGTVADEPGGASRPTPDEDGRGSALGTLAGIGVVFAIGCPICNKLALILLGTSGALSVFGAAQPLLAALSLGLLAASLGWRLRMRARPVACAARP
jgi:hypothetical protein